MANREMTLRLAYLQVPSWIKMPEKPFFTVLIVAKRPTFWGTVPQICPLSRGGALSPEFWSGEFWSGGPKFSVENWSGRTDFFWKNGPPLENWSE